MPGLPMFETFEHTADLGLRVRAADLESLFAEAGQALFAAILDNPSHVRPVRRVSIHVGGGDREYLLFDWLNELLYRFEVGRLVFARFEVRLSAEGLEAEAWGEPLDPSRHRLAREVKAVTYHGLKLAAVPDGWLAEVVVDI